MTETINKILSEYEIEKLSPMMRQYVEIKEKYDDCLLLFRLGDFYELFFDDAKTAGRELELTITGRACGLKERAPMCGVPYHAADQYIATLAEKGYKVAICEQVEDPAIANGIVKREVVRVITPGTIDLAGGAKPGENLFIASIFSYRKTVAIAYADVTTGELSVSEINVSHADELISEISRISPKEIITPEENSEKLLKILEKNAISTYINEIEGSYYKESTCQKIILEQFGVRSLMSLGLEGRASLVIATGSLLLYLADTQKKAPSQITDLQINDKKDHMRLDMSTIRNLELMETIYDKKVKGSLIGVLDKTKTAMGARLLKRFITEPLNNSIIINERLKAVREIKNNPIIKNDIGMELRHIYDFQRLTAKVASDRANAKDLIALKTTLEALPGLRALLNEVHSALTDRIRIDISDFSKLHDMIDEALTNDPPYTITDGGLIRDGFSEELDSIKESISEAKEWIAGLEISEKERTGIKTLKVGYNKVFGYYIDVSKSQIEKVPDEYIRKQTLVNNERYITPELKSKESLVMSAEAKINKIEYEIFQSIRAEVKPYIKLLQKASEAVALLDVILSFAEAAQVNGWVMPEVDNSSVIDIRDGRHPAVEALIGEGMFVANDTIMGMETQFDDACAVNGADYGKSMLIITGPNMSGKSTYMRQTAIIVLMAQIGSFVPAKSAHIGSVDRIFTRIGASDNLAHGQSTFFVEMSELANILRNATEKSLIILDEVGRGTSTFDGLSIAWATVEHLSEEGHKVRTMFATHYHELTVIADDNKSVKNLSVAVSDKGGDVIFLHKIVEGSASRSYGIHVAKIAGIPKEIRHNARKKLRELEASSSVRGNGSITEAQLSLFNDIDGAWDGKEYEGVINEIRELDIDNMTPVKALLELQELKDQLC